MDHIQVFFYAVSVQASMCQSSRRVVKEKINSDFLMSVDFLALGWQHFVNFIADLSGSENYSCSSDFMSRSMITAFSSTRSTSPRCFLYIVTLLLVNHPFFILLLSMHFSSC